MNHIEYSEGAQSMDGLSFVVDGAGYKTDYRITMRPNHLAKNSGAFRATHLSGDNCFTQVYIGTDHFARGDGYENANLVYSILQEGYTNEAERRKQASIAMEEVKKFALRSMDTIVSEDKIESVKLPDEIRKLLEKWMIQKNEKAFIRGSSFNDVWLDELNQEWHEKQEAKQKEPERLKGQGDW